jgi:SSS family solute:Na+ symporter
VDIAGKLKPLSKKQILPLSRWAIVVVGLCSLLLALALNGVISALLFAYTVYTGGLILPVIAGFYKKHLRVTPSGALAAIIGGGSAALLSKIFSIPYLDLGALAISAALLFLVSLIENRLKAR